MDAPNYKNVCPEDFEFFKNLRFLNSALPSPMWRVSSEQGKSFRKNLVYFAK